MAINVPDLARAIWFSWWSRASASIAAAAYCWQRISFSSPSSEIKGASPPFSLISAWISSIAARCQSARVACSCVPLLAPGGNQRRRVWGQSMWGTLDEGGTQRHSEALRGTQRDSEGLRGTQRDSEGGSQRLSEALSEALRGTQRHAEGGRGRQRHSEAIRVPPCSRLGPAARSAARDRLPPRS